MCQQISLQGLFCLKRKTPPYYRHLTDSVQHTYSKTKFHKHESFSTDSRQIRTLLAREIRSYISRLQRKLRKLYHNISYHQLYTVSYTQYTPEVYTSSVFTVKYRDSAHLSCHTNNYFSFTNISFLHFSVSQVSDTVLHSNKTPFFFLVVCFSQSITFTSLAAGKLKRRKRQFHKPYNPNVNSIGQIHSRTHYSSFTEWACHLHTLRSFLRSLHQLNLSSHFPR